MNIIRKPKLALAIASINAISFPRANKLKLFKQLLLLASLGGLSSCASLIDGFSQPEEVSNPAQQTQASTTQAQPAVNTNSSPLIQVQSPRIPENSGINRDGRVIQLGAFIENIPTIELPENDVIELNFEQEELQSVIQQIADALQISVLIDPTIDDRVSLRTSMNNPLNYDDLWPLLRMMSRNAGVTIEQAGSIYEFSKNASAIPVEIVMPDWLNNASSSEVLQITPLTYISRENATTILEPLLSAGSIITLGSGNLLGISGSPEQLARINALLSVIDDDPFQNQGIQLYELLNSDATEVAEELTTILQLVEGEQSSYQVLGLGRINSIIVLAPAARGFDEVDRWINILDAGTQEQVEQLFIYEVKNLTATTLADTLSEVFEQNEDIIPRDTEDETETVIITDAQESTTTQISAAIQGSSMVSANLTVTIVADEDTNSLLVRSTPRDYRQLLTTLSSLDKLPLQVLIHTVIGQVTLNNSMQFGVDWTRVSGNLSSGPARLSSLALPTGILDGLGQATAGSGLVLTQTFADGNAIINATLQAISQDNEVSLLSRPTIMATNNQEGEIKVGQAVPIDTGSSVSGNGTVVSNVSYRDVGIVLTITPHINADGFINLEIFQSLSAVEESSGGVSNNPIFTNQEISTTAVVENQSMITLGGLIQEIEVDQNSGVPLLRNIPIIGGLFSYQEQSFERRELFVIIRPEIVDGNQRETETMRTFRTQFELVSKLFNEAGI